MISKLKEGTIGNSNGEKAEIANLCYLYTDYYPYCSHFLFLLWTCKKEENGVENTTGLLQ